MGYRPTEMLKCISLPYNARIDGDLRIRQFGNIFVGPGVIIGCNCTLHQDVTISNQMADRPAPLIGDNVNINANAQLLGEMCVGNKAKLAPWRLS